MRDITNYQYRFQPNDPDKMEFFKDGVRIGQVFPDGVATSHDVLADSYEAQTPDYAATLAVTISAKRTLLAPAELGGNMTINATLSTALKGGEKLTMLIDSDGSVRTVTLGTNITGPALTTVANKKHVAQAEYVAGTGYVLTGPWVQID